MLSLERKSVCQVSAPSNFGHELPERDATHKQEKRSTSRLAILLGSQLLKHLKTPLMSKRKRMFGAGCPTIPLNLYKMQILNRTKAMWFARYWPSWFLENRKCQTKRITILSLSPLVNIFWIDMSNRVTLVAECPHGFKTSTPIPVFGDQCNQIRLLRWHLQLN